MKLNIHFISISESSSQALCIALGSVPLPKCPGFKEGITKVFQNFLREWMGFQTLFFLGLSWNDLGKLQPQISLPRDKLGDADGARTVGSRAGNYTLTIGLQSETQHPHRKINSRALKPWCPDLWDQRVSCNLSKWTLNKQQCGRFLFWPSNHMIMPELSCNSDFFLLPNYSLLLSADPHTKRISHRGFLLRKVLCVLWGDHILTQPMHKFCV